MLRSFVALGIGFVTCGATCVGAAPRALVAEASRDATVVVASARAVARADARDVTITVLADAASAARVARALPAYDAATAWFRVPVERSRVAAYPSGGGRRVAFAVVAIRPEPRRLAAYLERLETGLARDGAAAAVASIVARANDCAALDERALTLARDAATSDARTLGEAAGRRVTAAVASEDLSEAADHDAGRCSIGAVPEPLGRASATNVGVSLGRVASEGRIAVAFSTRAAGARDRRATPSARMTGLRESSVPYRYGAAFATARIRVDARHLGPVIAVVGTSAALGAADRVRYSWRSARGSAREALGTIATARRRLGALGIASGAIVVRAVGSPARVEFFVDVATARHLSGDIVAGAMVGPGRAARATVGEAFSRERCTELDVRTARTLVDSAYARAADLASALGTTPARPLALGFRGVAAPLCDEPDRYVVAPPRGAPVGGPVRPVALATYASADATYGLAGHPSAIARAVETSDAIPEAYFANAGSGASNVDVALDPNRLSIATRAVASQLVAPERGTIDITIASDRAHRFAPVDALRAYATVAPLERSAGRAPTRIVIVPGTAPHLDATGVTLHLEVRAPLDLADRRRLEALFAACRRLGRATLQIDEAAAIGPRVEARTRRIALAMAATAAGREARVRGLRLGDVVAVVEAEPFAERRITRDVSLASERTFAVVVRVDVTFAAEASRAPAR